MVYDFVETGDGLSLGLTQTCRQLRDEFRPLFQRKVIHEVPYHTLDQYIDAFHPEPPASTPQESNGAPLVDVPAICIIPPLRWTSEHRASIDIFQWLKKTTRPNFPYFQYSRDVDCSNEEQQQYIAVLSCFMMNHNLLRIFKAVHLKFVRKSKICDWKGCHVLDMVLAGEVQGNWVFAADYSLDDIVEEIEERVDEGDGYPMLDNLMTEISNAIDEVPQGQKWVVRVAYLPLKRERSGDEGRLSLEHKTMRRKQRKQTSSST